MTSKAEHKKLGNLWGSRAEYHEDKAKRDRELEAEHKRKAGPQKKSTKKK